MKTNSFQDLALLNKPRIIRTEYQKLAMTYGTTSLTPHQKQLYERLLFGLSVYTPEELYAMNSAKKTRIVKAHRKAQQILNLFKQETMNERLKAFLPEKMYNEIVTGIETDPSFKCTLSFKELGIGKSMIIQKLLEVKLLPSNFASL
jgi:hypothetical protein